MLRLWFIRSAVSLSLVGLFGLSLGQADATAEGACNSIIKHGLFDTFRQTSADFNYAESKQEVSRLQSEYERDSVSASANATYGGFRGRARFSREQVRVMSDAYLGNNYTKEQAQRDLNILSSIMNPTAIAAWQECVKSYSDGLRVTTDYDPNFEGRPLTIELRYIPPTQGAKQTILLTDIGFFPEDAWNIQSCRGSLAGFLRNKRPIPIGLNRQSLSCERKKSATPINDGPDKVYAKAASIFIDTQGGKVNRYVAAWPAEDPQPTLSQRLGYLEKLPFEYTLKTGVFYQIPNTVLRITADRGWVNLGNSSVITLPEDGRILIRGLLAYRAASTRPVLLQVLIDDRIEGRFIVTFRGILKFQFHRPVQRDTFRVLSD